MLLRYACNALTNKIQKKIASRRVELLYQPTFPLFPDKIQKKIASQNYSLQVSYSLKSLQQNSKENSKLRVVKKYGGEREGEICLTKFKRK